MSSQFDAKTADQAGASSGLAANVLQTRHIVVMSMAATGPAAVIALNFGPMAGFAGPDFVLAFVAVLVAVAILGNTLKEFARRYASAGALYTWVTRGFGPNVGFVFGWLYIGTFVVAGAAGAAVLGGWGEDWTSSAFGVAVPWWIWTIAIVLYTSVLAYRGVGLSLHGMLWLFGFEMIVMVALALTMYITGDVSNYTWDVFIPSSESGTGSGLAAVGLAMTFGVLSTAGIAEATTLAEETRDPKRVVSRGVLIAAVAIPAFYLFCAYAFIVGLGSEAFVNVDTTFVPLDNAAVKYWGGTVGLSIVTIAVLASIAAFVQTGFNAEARVMYTLGREGLLPRKLGRLHHQYQTPWISILVLSILIVAIAIPLGFAVGPFNVWAYLGFMIGLMFLIMYVIIHVALVVDTVRNHRAQFKWMRHGLLPAIGTLAMLYPLARTIYPLPEWPISLFALLVLVWIALGVLAMAILRRTRPEEIARAGAVIGE